MSQRVAFKSFVHGNEETNANSCLAFIRQAELKRDQIVSISMNETSVEDGENMITLFYREQSAHPEEVPLVNINFKFFDFSRTWAQLCNDFENFASKDRNVVANTHSAKGTLGTNN